jgi:ribulose-phosphate 3-epimerase
MKIIELNNIRDQQKLNFEIEIDGGVNKETSQICKKSGADVLVAGSYIFSGTKDNYKTLIDSLR